MDRPTQANLANRKTIRVLHVFASLERGGAETWLMDIMRHSDRKRLSIDVCLINKNDGAYEAEFQNLGGRIFRCPLNKNPLKFYRAFHKLLKREAFDAVHSHLFLFSGLLLRAADLAGIPQRIAHIHPIVDVKVNRSLRSIYASWMRRWIKKHGTHFVAPTEEGLVSFWGPNWSADCNKCVIYNGLKVDRFIESIDRNQLRKELDLPLKANIVLNVARFAPHKRQGYLVEIAAHIINRLENKDIYFVLLGSGDLRQQTIALAKEQGLMDRFRFISGAPNIDKFWLSADAFAFPSSNEGFGIVVAEAAAAGLPVVAQDIPGIREAATACHDINLLPINTSASQWARTLEDAIKRGPLSDQQRIQRLKTFRFTIESSVASLEKLYNLGDK